MKKPRVQNTFLEELRKIPIVQVACERCNVSRQSVYRWRSEDPEFAKQMDAALSEGDLVVNDLCESKLLTLIKNGDFRAVRYFLDKRHPKYRELSKDEEDESKAHRMLRKLGLTGES